VSQTIDRKSITQKIRRRYLCIFNQSRDMSELTAINLSTKASKLPRHGISLLRLVSNPALSPSLRLQHQEHHWGGGRWGICIPLNLKNSDFCVFAHTIFFFLLCPLPRKSVEIVPPLEKSEMTSLYSTIPLYTPFSPLYSSVVLTRTKNLVRRVDFCRRLLGLHEGR